ncbi:uncharacterized protein LOC109801812 isoform X1 [Cajanus cajan]|uniref:uncharacterized protein LOC109801812 isoform X1 n=1 Tax=Cajanus cajan TaxID=3821 RepID=UPI00098DB22E|nr:uncharacterized protein LOC109801812 isoform X1 [Cajanus cajan]
MSAAFSATPSAAQVLSLFRSLLRVAREFPDYTSGNTPNAAPSMRFVKTPPSPTLLPFPPPSPVASLSSRSLNDRPSCTLSTPLRFAASWNSNNPPYSREDPNPSFRLFAFGHLSVEYIRPYDMSTNNWRSKGNLSKILESPSVLEGILRVCMVDASQSRVFRFINVSNLCASYTTPTKFVPIW